MRISVDPRDVEQSELVAKCWRDLEGALAWHLRVDGLHIDAMQLTTRGGSLLSMVARDVEEADERRARNERFHERARAVLDDTDRNEIARLEAIERTRQAEADAIAADRHARSVADAEAKRRRIAARGRRGQGA